MAVTAAACSSVDKLLGNMAPVAGTAIYILMQTAFFGNEVGRARREAKVTAPARSADDGGRLERTHAAQQNRLEHQSYVIPIMTVAGLYTDPILASAIGLFYGYQSRQYMHAYAEQADKRGPYFYQAVKATYALLGLAVFGLANAAVRHYFNVDILATVGLRPFVNKYRKAVRLD